MKQLAAVLLAFCATASLAEQPSREQVTRAVYMLRARPFGASSSQYQGFFRYDPDTKLYTPVLMLNYGAEHQRVLGSLRLGATADRLILQGPDYLEIDAVSGRILRRYEGTDASTKGAWAFQGTIVSEEQARALAIPAGTYGFPACVVEMLIFDIPFACAPYPFPGYTTPTSMPYSVLLRRSLDPSERSLTPVKILGATNTSASIALDFPSRQFWLWTQNSIGRMWSTLPLTAGVVGDPVPSSLLASDGTLLSLAFQTPTRSLFELLSTSGFGFLPRTLQQQSTSDVTTAPSIIESMPADTSSQQIDSVTALSDPLPDRYVQVIPAIGETPGANGTFWHSDLWLYNPAAEAIDITLRRVARPDRAMTQHLAAHASLPIRNVLTTLGGGPAGDGVTTDALVIDSPFHWGTQLAAYSRTYTARSDGGTYGQSVPAVPSAVGYSNHTRDFNSPVDTPGFPSTIILDKRDAARFRHNVGVVNDSDAGFDVRLYDGFHKFTISVAAHSVNNINLEALFTDSNAVLFAADRPAPVWLSMIDNTSGDATFVPFTTLALVADGTGEMAVPAVGTTRVAGATTWRTDLYGTFATNTVGQTLTHPLAHLDASGGCTADTHLDVEGSFIYRDVAGQFAACQGPGGVVGALRMPASSWMQGYSRTYTTRADGGTFGDILPFYPPNGWPVQHFSGVEIGPRFRINVGLYNGSMVATTNRLLLYDANGALVGTHDIDLAPHDSLQGPIASIMSAANLPAGIYGLSVVPLGDGRSWAYVSLVDNISGDPTNLW